MEEVYLFELKKEIIKDWNNQEFVDYSFSGKPFWLLTIDNKVIVCCHFDLDKGFRFPELIEYLVMKYYKKYEIEIICCYPTSAKQDKIFGKYINIESNFPVTASYNNMGNLCEVTFLEKI